MFPNGELIKEKTSEVHKRLHEVFTENVKAGTFTTIQQCLELTNTIR